MYVCSTKEKGGFITEFCKFTKISQWPPFAGEINQMGWKKWGKIFNIFPVLHFTCSREGALFKLINLANMIVHWKKNIEM
jgi:hypothetical protein